MNIFVFIIFGVFVVVCALIDIRCKSAHLKKRAIVLLAVLFSLYAAFRSLDVPDTKFYSEFLGQVRRNIIDYGFFSNAVFHAYSDSGFSVFTAIVACFTTDVSVYFFAIAFCQVLVVIAALKNYRYKLLALCAYVSFSGFYFAFIILRAGFAIALFLYAVLRCQKKPVRKLLVFILAYLFHASALVGIIFYLIACLSKRTLRFKRALAICVFAFVFYVLGGGRLFILPVISALSRVEWGIPIINRGLYYFADYEIKMFDVSYRFIVNVIIYLFWSYVINRDPTARLDKTVIISDKLLIFGIILNSLLGSSVLIGRILDVLFIMIVPALAQFFTLYIEQKQKTSASFAATHEYTAQFFALRTRLILIVVFYVLFNLIFFYRIAG